MAAVRVKIGVGLETGTFARWKRLASTISIRLLIGFQAGEPVGIAYCFAMDMDLTRLVTEDPPEVIAAVKTWKPAFMELRVLEIGHVASLGTTIEAEPQLQGAFLRALGGAVEEIAALEDADLSSVTCSERFGSFGSRTGRLSADDGLPDRSHEPRLQALMDTSPLKSKKRSDVSRRRAALISLKSRSKSSKTMPRTRSDSPNSGARWRGGTPNTSTSV
jgi:hypothetical protein